MRMRASVRAGPELQGHLARPSRPDGSDRQGGDGGVSPAALVGLAYQFPGILFDRQTCQHHQIDDQKDMSNYMSTSALFPDQSMT